MKLRAVRFLQKYRYRSKLLVYHLQSCVEELADLEALNKQLAKKGGAVFGINSFTLDGDKTAISDAKNILAKRALPTKTFGLIQK